MLRKMERLGLSGGLPPEIGSQFYTSLTQLNWVSWPLQAPPPHCGNLISKRQDPQGVTLPAYALAADLRAMNKQERTGSPDKGSIRKGPGCVEKGNVPFPFSWALTVHRPKYSNGESLSTSFL